MFKRLKSTIEFIVIVGMFIYSLNSVYIALSNPSLTRTQVFYKSIGMGDK